MDELLRKFAELVPIIREGPVWLQYLFLVWISVTAIFLVGFLTFLLHRVGNFTVLNLSDKQSIVEREFGLTGTGLPRDCEPEIKVYRVEGGNHNEVPQHGTTLRNEDGTWRFEFLSFREEGEHEVDIRILRNSKSIRFLSPIRVRVWPGVAKPAPLPFAGTQIEPETPWTGAVQYDLSKWVSIHDQGQEGTSPAFAAITAMETFLHRQGKPVSLSARYVYEKAKKHDESGLSEGTWLNAIAYAVEQFGAPPEGEWPYKPLSRSLPPGKTWGQLDAAAIYKARLYRISSLDDIPQQLSAGRPILTGLEIYASSLDNAEVMRTGRLITPIPGESPIGGHAVVIVAWNPTDRSFLFANSWGTPWGAKGFGTMDEETAKVLTRSQDAWGVEVVQAGQ
jgi:hypothetical protein